MAGELQESPGADAAASPAAWWRFPIHFTAHVLVGTFLFLLVAGVALVLALLIKWLEAKGLDWPFIYGLKLAEYSVFGVDLLSFLVFLVRSFRTTLEEF